MQRDEDRELLEQVASAFSAAYAEFVRKNDASMIQPHYPLQIRDAFAADKYFMPIQNLSLWDMIFNADCAFSSDRIIEGCELLYFAKAKFGREAARVAVDARITERREVDEWNVLQYERAECCQKVIADHGGGVFLSEIPDWQSKVQAEVERKWRENEQFEKNHGLREPDLLVRAFEQTEEYLRRFRRGVA